MRYILPLLLIGSMAVDLGGCVPTVALAPGADAVRVTTTVSDVANCKPVGNLATPRNEKGGVNLENAANQFRNQAVGLGGNAAFVTDGSLNIPYEGIAYRCP